MTPKVSVAAVAGYSNSCGYARGTDHAVATILIAYMYSAKVARLAKVTFGHAALQVSDDLIVIRHLVKRLMRLSDSYCP